MSIGGTGRTALHESLRIPALIFAICLLVVGMSLFGTIMYAVHVSGEQRARTVATCERGNIVRSKQNAVIVFLNEKFGYTGIPTPLVVCGEIK